MKQSPSTLVPDRRDEERYTVTQDVFWQGDGGRSQGTISDLNWSGCLILAEDNVKKGEKIHVFLPVRGGTRVQISGTVTNFAEEIGFGLKFDDLGEDQWQAINDLIARDLKA